MRMKTKFFLLKMTLVYSVLAGFLHDIRIVTDAHDFIDIGWAHQEGLLKFY